ncbi:hypothetical protein RUM43_007958 [Polyplax serrata]|uniref:MADF domain-containing protein n=1 Tax=Polyplax serrata TaxID=468196 RepID=A0AAN8P6E6_POLSC
MDDDLLIECVRQYEVLFDPSHPKYMDFSYKNDVWNEIGDQLQVNVYACKSRWNNIRDTYRKSLRKSTTRSGQSTRKKYKLAPKLTFLNKYLADRKSNIEYDAEEKEDCVRTVIKSDPEDQTQEEDSESRLTPLAVQTCEVLGEQEPKGKHHYFPKYPLAAQADSAIELVNGLVNKNECQVYCPPSSHPIDAFLAGISPTLKTFSPYHLHLAKSEIFAVVQKFELKTIMGETWTGT